jgi:hypothetical protein
LEGISFYAVQGLWFFRSVPKFLGLLEGEKNMMSYEEKWKVLADLIIELQEKGEKIPADVMTDLRSAKTMIQVLRADPTYMENISRIDAYLRSVESYGIFTAEKYGTDFVEEWLKKLEEPKEVKVKEKKIASRFIPGIPRDRNWVRIEISEDISQEKIKKLADQSHVSCKMLENGYLFVYGDGENIKAFMKKMTERFRGIKNG